MPLGGICSPRKGEFRGVRLQIIKHPSSARADSKAEPPPPGQARLSSVDAYRGLVMFLMLAEVLRLCAVSAAQPNSTFWRLLCHQQTHAAWVGCSLHDLIQPGFYFLVGVALPFSIASRLARGQAFTSMLGHAVGRSLILIGLGLIMIAVHPRRWVWQFDDTLSQIGLAYPFAFLLAFRRPRERWIAFAIVLTGYWLWFALTPLPRPDFDFAAVGVPADWLSEHGLAGFAAHWQINSNPAAAFDRWFLNLFSRNTVYTGSLNGLTTLNFIPSIGTMLLGLAAGDVLRGTHPPWGKVRRLALAGALLLSIGWVLGALGVCPVVKAIWTPSWVLFSGGWCFLFLAAFYALVDIGGMRRWVFPLIVIGSNSIVAYSISHFYPALAYNSLRRVVGDGVFRIFGDAYEAFVYGSVILLGYWLFLFILYRRKLLLRI